MTKIELKSRRLRLGYRSRGALAGVLGVSTRALDSYEEGWRPIPEWVGRFLTRLEGPVSLYAKFGVNRPEDLRNEISVHTGFDCGELFDDAEDVRSYFLMGVMEEIFPGYSVESGLSQADLSAMADLVIEHGWHMIPPTQKK